MRPSAKWRYQNMAVYEFFKKEFEFWGKHARMAGELCI